MLFCNESLLQDLHCSNCNDLGACLLPVLDAEEMPVKISGAGNTSLKKENQKNPKTSGFFSGNEIVIPSICNMYFTDCPRLGLVHHDAFMQTSLKLLDLQICSNGVSFSK